MRYIRKAALATTVIVVSLIALAATQLGASEPGQGVSAAAADLTETSTAPTPSPRPEPPGQHAPTAQDGEANAFSGITVDNIRLEGRDADFCGAGQMFSLFGVTLPSHGTLSNQDWPGTCQDQPANGYALLITTFDYTSDAGFVGTDTFTFAYSDGFQTSNQATFTVHVQAGGAPTPTPTPTPPGTPTPTSDPTGEPPPTGEPTPTPAASGGTVTTVAIDTDTAGNTGSAVGTIDTCISVSNGSAFTIDVVMAGLPAGQQLAGVSYDIDYNSAVVQLGNDDDGDGRFDEDTVVGDGDQDGDGKDGEEGKGGGGTIGHESNFLFLGATDWSQGNGNDGPPVSSTSTGTWSDFSFTFFTFSGYPSGPKDGVLNRITVKAVGAGVSTLNLRDLYGTGDANSPPTLVDNSAASFTIGNGSSGDATIAVDTACVTPAPTIPPTSTPSFTPVGQTPTPTPTPTGPTPTSTPEGQTPTPTPTPTPTIGPTPSPCHVVWDCIQVAQGDVDCNDAITSVDALKELRHVAQLSVSKSEPCPDIGTATESMWGDVDCNGDVTSVDALKILRHVAGLAVSQTQPCPDIGGPLT